MNLEFLDSLEFLTRTWRHRKANLQSTLIFPFPAPFHTVRTSHIHMWKLQTACPSSGHVPLQITTCWPLRESKGTHVCNAAHLCEDRPVYPYPNNGQEIPEPWIQSVYSLQGRVCVLVRHAHLAPQIPCPVWRCVARGQG